MGRDILKQFPRPKVKQLQMAILEHQVPGDGRGRDCPILLVEMTHTFVPARICRSPGTKVEQRTYLDDMVCTQWLEALRYGNKGVKPHSTVGVN